jgi:predicted transcriptional regulator
MKKSFLKRTIKEVETLVDTNSGEVVQTNIKQHSYLANSREEFFLCYSSILGIFMQMEQSEIRVFGYLLRFADGTKFDITKKVRIEIAENTQLNERTIYNILPNLLEKKLIFKHENGLYQINPRYAYRGSTSNRNESLVAVLKLNCNL